METPRRTIVPGKPYLKEQLSPGVTLHKLYPGGLHGPNGEVQGDIPGGQTWSDMVMLGGADDPFVLGLPDIRLPPNQYWPLHWHDCWTVVLVLEGNCTIGDWHMRADDVFVAAPSIEYGPLVIGPQGCRMFEIFAKLHLAPGGYAPEYRDHPTLRGGNYVFKERVGDNSRNAGRSSLPLDGVAGVWKTRLAPGWAWELGEADDPDRGVLKDVRIRPRETIAARKPLDWHGLIVLDGSIEHAGRTLVRDDVLVTQPGGELEKIAGGRDGARLLECGRTPRAL